MLTGTLSSKECGNEPRFFNDNTTKNRKLESFLDLLCYTLHRNVDDHKSLLYYCNGFCGFDLIDGQANTETGPYRFNQLCVVY